MLLRAKSAKFSENLNLYSLSFNFQGPRHQQHPWFSGYQQQQMFPGTSIKRGYLRRAI